ncbi:hypothetical protein pVco7_gp035 [Vibrio phage pVco-7]
MLLIPIFGAAFKPENYVLNFQYKFKQFTIDVDFADREMTKKHIEIYASKPTRNWNRGKVRIPKGFKYI